MSLLTALLDLLFPPKCPFCGKVLDKPGICPKCEKDLPWVSDAEALREGPGGLRCAGGVWYEDTAREALLRLKFHGNSAAAGPMGELIARCAAERFAGEFDTVTWAPVSKKRLRKRGYDQAELLARSACKLWDTEPVRLLEKVMDNPPQSDAELMKGKRILLVDDICTTGATLTECIRVLKDAGAADVVCAVVALTRQEKVHNSARE